MNLGRLRADVASGKRRLRITTHAQVEAAKDGLLLAESMICNTCGSPMIENGTAIEIYRLNGMVITVTGIPAVRVCSRCNHAVIEWDIAQQVEDLVQPMLRWAKSHSLPGPQVTVAFAQRERLAA